MRCIFTNVKHGFHFDYLANHPHIWSPLLANSFTMGSRQPPKKKIKISVENPAHDITSFSDLGLQFHEPGDNVIYHHTSSSDGRGVWTTTTTAAPLRERVYTTIDAQGDWDAFQYQEEGDSRPTDPSQFVFQVKKGRVSKVHKKAFSSVSHNIKHGFAWFKCKF